MLKQLEDLSLATDGRYATDDELQYLQTYLSTIALRVQAYEKIKAAEVEIIQQARATLTATYPDLLQLDGADMSAKWQRDTIRVLRYAALALLMDDADWFKEQLLVWFSSVMAAFRVERSCDVTYKTMQRITQQHLTPSETQLFMPVWESCCEVMLAKLRESTAKGLRQVDIDPGLHPINKMPVFFQSIS